MVWKRAVPVLNLARGSKPDEAKQRLGCDVACTNLSHSISKRKRLISPTYGVIGCLRHNDSSTSIHSSPYFPYSQ